MRMDAGLEVAEAVDWESELQRGLKTRKCRGRLGECEDRKRRQKRKSGHSEKRWRRTVREKLGAHAGVRPQKPEKSSSRTAKVQDDKLFPFKCQGAGSFEAVLDRESLGGRYPSMNSRPPELGLPKSEVSRLSLTRAFLSLGLPTAGSRVHCPECPPPPHPLSKQFLSSSSTWLSSPRARLCF